jgi:hypothetical protein
MFVLFLSMSMVWVVIAIPYLTPQAEPVTEPYPWLTLGTDSIINELWDANAQKFKEMPTNSTGYWVDDQAKLLWLMLQDPAKYDSYITKTVDNLYSVSIGGYFPRRWITLQPKIVSSVTSNVELENGFLKIMGDLTGQNATNPLKVRYYEAAGYSDLFYLGGQLFTVVRSDRDYQWITYHIVHLDAEESQNPSFDVWNPTWTKEHMLQPWMYSRPDHWNPSIDPPLGCSYSTRWIDKPDTGKRCIGLERYVTGTSKYWVSDAFTVAENASCTLNFKYRGEFYSGSPFSVHLRWYNSTGFISENVTTFSQTFNSWQQFSQPYTCPPTSNHADLLFWSEADTNGNYYFDDVSMSGGTAPILNGNFETAYSYYFDESVFHSGLNATWGRSLRLYGTDEYAMEWLPVAVPVSNFYNLTYWSQSAIPTTNIKVQVLYSDGSYSELTKPINESSWVFRAVQQDELSAGKTIVAFGFKTGTSGISTYIDDVAFHYKPSNAQNSFDVSSYTDNYGVLQYVETVQSYADDDVNLTMNFRFSRNATYIEKLNRYENKKSYATTVYFTSALDGLSTVTSGEGTQKTAYSSVWIPEIGERVHQPGLYTTTLMYPDEKSKWSKKHDYFIVELKQIPEWAGSYGIVIKVPPENFYLIQDSNENATYPETDPYYNTYLHYLTYSFKFDVQANGVQTFSPKIICLNGYDFTLPGIYDYYLMNLENYPSVDLSMNYHIGTIDHALARYYEVLNIDPKGMGLATWNYYRNVFNVSHNNGSYLITTGKMIEASMIYYRKLGDAKYLDFAKYLGDYLVNLQVTNSSDKRYGTFPMKHNGISYLDCHAGSLIGLKLLRSYGSSYDQAYQLGISVIHYDYKPSGFGKILDPSDYGTQTPNIKRLFVYANASCIDDDFFTFKSGHVALASLGYNETLTMIGLSRVWRNVEWNLTDVIVYVCESTPERTIPGTRSDWISTNSETQPYGLIPWLEVAKYQRSNFQYYYEFLMKHYAIEYASISRGSLNVNISGDNGIGTVSAFYLKGMEEKAIPQSISVDGETVGKIDNLNSLYPSPDNCYYYDSGNYSLIVKAFVKTANTAKLEIIWNLNPPEPWMPILPLMGTFGFIMVCISLVYGIEKIKSGEFLEGSAIALMMFLIGFALIVGWLWSV